jgi:glycosyltransferase involved in cell wall biosynthesis
MRIAQVSPLCESVPPKGYGGTERVVSYLTEALVDLGHEVTLFASGDSETRARLVPVCARSLRLDQSVIDPIAPHVLLAERVMAQAAEFDLIHWHIDYLHFSLSRRYPTPHVTTLHGRLDLPHLPPIYDEFSDIPVVSISNAQRAPLPQARWAGTVHHGLPPELYQAGAGGDYFVFLGRISPEKRVDRAVQIATRLGVPLIVAAKIDRADEEYYQREIASSFENPLVEFIGEVDEPAKQKLLCGARALLFPIDWPEPFGLVMIEAMACGTPVIAYRRGSVPEVMVDGVTGFVVDDDEQAAAAAARAGELDRRAIRRVFEQRFTSRTMAENYVATYAELIRAKSAAPREVAA